MLVGPVQNLSQDRSRQAFLHTGINRMGSTSDESASSRTYYVFCRATALVSAGAKTVTFPYKWSEARLNRYEHIRWFHFIEYCKKHHIEIRFQK